MNAEEFARGFHLRPSGVMAPAEARVQEHWTRGQRRVLFSALRLLGEKSIAINLKCKDCGEPPRPVRDAFTGQSVNLQCACRDRVFEQKV